MMKMIKVRKYEYILLALCIISIFLYLPWNGTKLRYDIFPFYDYSSESDYIGRKLGVLIYEISTYFRQVALAFMFWMRLKHYVFFVVFCILALEFILYLGWFGQDTDPYLIGFSGALIFSIMIKYKINGYKVKV